jgi:hypothetical protein
MAKKTNRREFVQVAGLTASGLIAAARPLDAAVPEPQARPAPRTTVTTASERTYVKGFVEVALSTIVGGNGDAVSSGLGYGASAPTGTDYTAAIQTALNTVAAYNGGSGGRLIWDGAWGVTGLTIPSNVWIFCPSANCGAILRNGSNQRMFANSGSANGNGDTSPNHQNSWGAEIGRNSLYRSLGPFANSNIRISGGTWNGNRANNKGNINSAMSTVNGVLSAFQMYGVNGLIIEGVTTYSFAGYAITGCNLFGGIFRDNVIDQSPTAAALTDGIHINGPARNLRIINNKIHAYDDPVAILPDDGSGTPQTWYPIAGDITDFRIQDLSIYSGLQGDSDIGGIRLLSAGSLLDDGVISRVSGATTRACFRIGNNGGGTYHDGKGNFGDIVFEDTSIQVTNGPCFTIDGSFWGELKIVRRRAINPGNHPDVVIENTGGGKTVNSLLYNYSSYISHGQTDPAQPKIQVAGPVSNLRVEAMSDLRDNSFTANANSSVVHITSGGSVGVLHFSGHVDRAGYVVGADEGTTLRTVVMDGLHSNANGGSPLVLGSGVTVKNAMHNNLSHVGAFKSGSGTITNDSASSFALGNHYAD